MYSGSPMPSSGFLAYSDPYVFTDPTNPVITDVTEDGVTTHTSTYACKVTEQTAGYPIESVEFTILENVPGGKEANLVVPVNE